MAERIFPVATLRRLASLFVEFGILCFCAIILSGTGKTEGPVFDTVGPDLFPTALALIVGGLTFVQIAVELLGKGDPAALPGRPDWQMMRSTLIFFAATAIYVFLLAQRLAPLYLATCAFMACTTALLSHRPDWRDVALGAAIGLGLGGVLQFVFTRILVIDLPS